MLLFLVIKWLCISGFNYWMGFPSSNIQAKLECSMPTYPVNLPEQGPILGFGILVPKHSNFI